MTADILKVEGLTKTYGETLVLDNVGFTVAQNSIVGVVGENGAGKSTLFNIISGIVRPDSGRIEFRGKEDPAGELQGGQPAGYLASFSKSRRLFLI